MSAVEHAAETQSVVAFAGSNARYYLRVFGAIRANGDRLAPFNVAAALLGPAWAAARNLGGLFWLLLVLELAAVGMCATGASGNLGFAERERAERLEAQAVRRESESAALAGEDAARAAGLSRTAAALRNTSAAVAARAAESAAWGTVLLWCGVVLFVLGRVSAGFAANALLERRYLEWRSDPRLRAGLALGNGMAAAVLWLTACGLLAWRMAARLPPAWLLEAPANRSWQTGLAGRIDSGLDALARSGAPFFDAVTRFIDAMLGGITGVLMLTPWPVLAALVVLAARQLAGIRVALLTAVGLAYLVVFGYWERSLETIALIGTSALISLVLGIPLGIACGRRPAIYAAVRPVLDFMQTMPAFVYLIPVIALFGIGKPPGVIATVVFGTPPAVRLTALGIAGVPAAVREAAIACGATRAFLLLRVDLPLAAPSIMAGINQSLLMCLSMVVVASLIGARGLGEDVLSALQFAAVGQGLLAGFAILVCAVILDRIVQGGGGGAQDRQDPESRR